MMKSGIGRFWSLIRMDQNSEQCLQEMHRSSRMTKIWIWSKSHRRRNRLYAVSWTMENTALNSKEARKNQKVVSIKEIRMFSAIDTHDFETKVNQAKKFLQGGDKLKVSVRFRKRAIAHPQIGEELLKQFKDACAEVGVVEKPAKMEGRSMVLFISPKASK